MGAVEEGRKALLGDGARVIERGDDLCRLLLARPAHLVAGKGGIEQHLTEQVKTRGEVLGEELRADHRGFDTRRRIQAATERIDRSRQRLRREGSRAAAEGGGRQRGEPGLARWILSCAGADHDVELDERQLVILGDDQAKPIVEGRSPDRRELVCPAAGCERDEEDGDGERRLHRTAPPVGMRSPAGRPDGTGTRTITVRWVGTRSVAASRRTSSTVTASHSASRRKMAR